MKLKKILTAGIAAAIIFSASSTFAATSAVEKLVKIEIDAYGAEQVGAALNRIGKLEKDFSGKNFQGNMNARIDSIYDSLYSNDGEPSIISKLNALEWNFGKEVSSGGVNERISKLENEILGKENSGGFNSRISELSKAAFGRENIPLKKISLPENTLIKIALVDSINSKDLQVGDEVKFKVAEDVILNGNLVFAKGLIGTGKVVSVRKAKGWTGRNGKVEIDFNELRAVDGRNVETFVGFEAKSAMIDKEMVDGASLVAMNLNDDWNKVLVRGKNVDIKPGTELFIQTKNSDEIFALETSFKNASEKISPQKNSTEKNSADKISENDEENFYLDDEE